MATSEEIVINETLSGRIYKQPRMLALSVDGRLTLPDGVDIDFSRVGTFQVPQTLKTELVNTVISQMPSVLDGNIIHLNTNSSATDAVSSMVLASYNGDIVGNTGLNDAVYNTITGSLNSGMTGSVGYSGITNSWTSSITNPSAPQINELSINASDACTIENSAATNTKNCAIEASYQSHIGPSTFNSYYNTVAGSLQSTVYSGTGNSIRESKLCTITPATISNAESSFLTIGTSENSSISGRATECGILYSNGAVINGNTTSVTTRNSIISSYNTNLTGNCYENQSLGSDTCSISCTDTVNVSGRNSMIGGLSNTMTGPNVGCSMINTRNSSITSANSASQRCDSCGMYACQAGTISGNGFLRSVLLATDSCTLANNGSVSSNTSNNLIASSVSSSITKNVSDKLLFRNTVIGSNSVAITNSGVDTYNNMMIANVNGLIDGGVSNSIISSESSNSTISAGLTPNRYNSIIGCGTCNISNTNAALNAPQFNTMISSANSTISGNAARNSMIASQACFITGSTSSQISRSVIIAATGQTLNPGSFCTLMGGSTPSSSNGYSNCLCWSASPTASNQAVFGVNTRIAGSGNNLAVEGGYVRASSGFVDNVRSASAPTTLAFGDSTIILNSGSTLTLPLAATFGANYPLDTVVKFKVVRAAAGSNNTILTTGLDRFNDTANWSSLIDTMNGRHPYLEILLINTTIKPHWRFAHPIKVGATFHSFSIDNNFGVTPPKSDANQLPTSTTQATHEALGATSYVYLWQTAEQTQGVLSLSLAGTYGVQINVPAAYRITYRFDVKTVSGGSRYLIRSDVRQNSTGLTILGSYAETAGLNVQDGTRHVEVTLPTAFYDVGEILTIRLSQDAASTINATASIRAPAMILDGQI